MPTITVNEEIPGPDEFIALRAAAGLSPRTPEAARLGLPRSLFAVCVRREAELIGMGRIVGDGGCSFQIVDIAVHPDYQRQGLGTRIMAALVHYIRESAPASAHVSLLADRGAQALYSKFGFELTAPDSVGMALRRG